MLMLELSAGQGPAECALAVAHGVRQLLKEAQALGVDAELLEQTPGDASGSVRSALLSLQGESARTLLTRWQGNLLWQCPSPLRPRHKRKNWFFQGVALTPPADGSAISIQYQSCKASGPGGQHVNTTNSAVRATHPESGASVKVSSQRSQHANKRLAKALLLAKLEQQRQQLQADSRTQRHQAHHNLERGQPKRIFTGPKFRES